MVGLDGSGSSGDVRGPGLLAGKPMTRVPRYIQGRVSPFRKDPKTGSIIGYVAVVERTGKRNAYGSIEEKVLHEEQMVVDPDSGDLTPLDYVRNLIQEAGQACVDWAKANLGDEKLAEMVDIP